ncbi:MAG: hypothetical protein M3Q58_16315 [Bacteroidota bacterium]|nr:hypothetical protein [Bacteroidota bacterium]
MGYSNSVSNFGVNIIAFLFAFLFTGCGKIELNNEEKIKQHLKEHTFEYGDRKNNMTSFMQFKESSCELIIFLNGKEFTSKNYSYSLGEFNFDKRLINIEENEGSWGIKEDGNLYLWNKGELFIYRHVKL